MVRAAKLVRKWAVLQLFQNDPEEAGIVASWCNHHFHWRRLSLVRRRPQLTITSNLDDLESTRRLAVRRRVNCKADDAGGEHGAGLLVARRDLERIAPTGLRLEVHGVASGTAPAGDAKGNRPRPHEAGE